MGVKIDIGCGEYKREGHIGVDRVKTNAVDVVADLEFRLPFKDQVIDEIYTSHTLEHITRFEQAMEEIHSILRQNGLLTVLVPHFSNPLAFSDFTHKRFFGLQTFDYFQKTEDQPKERTVPAFYTKYRFRVISRRLIFYELHSKLGEIILSKFVNRSFRSQLFYEKHLPWILPCREIRFELRRCS